MSDFVSNVVRRGAGLGAVVWPRRREVPLEQDLPDWPPPEATAEESTSAPLETAPPAVSERALLRPRPAGLPGRIDDATPDGPAPSVVRLPSANGADRTIPASPLQPRPTTPSLAASTLKPASVAEPPVVTGLREELPLESGRTDSVLVPVASPDAPKSRRESDRAVAALVDAPPRTRVLLVPASTVPSPVTLPPARQGVGSTTPRVEVQIGRIEIVQAQSPTRPATRPRRLPRGFAAQAPSRRHLDRRWY
jgi:hypothetical protein